VKRVVYNVVWIDRAERTLAVKTFGTRSQAQEFFGNTPTSFRVVECELHGEPTWIDEREDYGEDVLGERPHGR